MDRERAGSGAAVDGCRGNGRPPRPQRGGGGRRPSRRRRLRVVRVAGGVCRRRPPPPVRPTRSGQLRLGSSSRRPGGRRRRRARGGARLRLHRRRGRPGPGWKRSWPRPGLRRTRLAAGLAAANAAAAEGGATTLVLGLIDRAGELRLARVGDSTAFLVSDEGRSWRELFPPPDDDAMATATAALPADEMEPELASVTLTAEDVILLATDGVADPWRDGPTTVAPALAAALAGRPGSAGAGPAGRLLPPGLPRRPHHAGRLARVPVAAAP